MKIGFVSGTFDLVHTGHLMMFEECKMRCDYLIVGLCFNPSVIQIEKNKPVEGVFERFIRLRAARNVDEIIVFETEKEKYELINFFYAKYEKNFIYFMSEEYSDRGRVGLNPDIEVYYNSRKHDYSSSNLRKRACII